MSQAEEDLTISVEVLEMIRSGYPLKKTAIDKIKNLYCTNKDIIWTVTNSDELSNVLEN